MKRRSTNYSQADAGGWMHKCDDLFLARYRGKPCEICGNTKGRDGDHVVSSCGHHLIFKGSIFCHYGYTIFVLGAGLGRGVGDGIA